MGQVERPPIEPLRPDFTVQCLSIEQLDQLQEATFNILENVGVRFPSEMALDVWEAHGADVDRESQIVKAPGVVIEAGLKQAPPAYTLAARHPVQDLPLDGNHVFAGTDGCGVEIIDLHSGEKRRTGLEDVAEIVRVADYLEEVGFH